MSPCLSKGNGLIILPHTTGSTADLGFAAIFRDNSHKGL